MNKYFNDDINWQTVSSNYYFRKQRKHLHECIFILRNNTLHGSEIEIIERKIRAIELDIYGRVI